MTHLSLYLVDLGTQSYIFAQTSARGAGRGCPGGGGGSLSKRALYFTSANKQHGYNGKIFLVDLTD